MGLEVATYINQLVTTNPDGTDAKSQGDDHLRLVKSVLKNTFPNITGAVTATQDDLNKTSVVGNFCFPGMIVMWSGAVGSIPDGWKICNGVGTISTGAAVPDLRGRFIFGTDGTTPGPIGTSGGTANIAISGSTNGHAITVDQMPNHGHSLNPAAQYNTGDTPANAPVNRISGAPDYNLLFPGTADLQAQDYITTTGGSQAHSHVINISLPFANLPPFYELAFLIKN